MSNPELVSAILLSKIAKISMYTQCSASRCLFYASNLVTIHVCCLQWRSQNKCFRGISLGRVQQNIDNEM